MAAMGCYEVHACCYGVCIMGTCWWSYGSYEVYIGLYCHVFFSWCNTSLTVCCNTFWLYPLQHLPHKCSTILSCLLPLSLCRWLKMVRKKSFTSSSSAHGQFISDSTVHITNTCIVIIDKHCGSTSWPHVSSTSLWDSHCTNECLVWYWWWWAQWWGSNSNRGEHVNSSVCVACSGSGPASLTNGTNNKSPINLLYHQTNIRFKDRTRVPIPISHWRTYIILNIQNRFVIVMCSINIELKCMKVTSKYYHNSLNSRHTCICDAHPFPVTLLQHFTTICCNTSHVNAQRFLPICCLLVLCLTQQFWFQASEPNQWHQW